MLVKEGFVSGKKYKVRKDSPNVSVVLLEKLNTLLEDLRNIPGNILSGPLGLGHVNEL